MGKYLFAFLFLSIPLSSAAEWKLKELIDPIDDSKKKVAVIVNDLGHSFSLYRLSEGGEVWGNFSLSKKSFDTLSHKKPLIYRVDKNKSTEIDLSSSLEKYGIKHSEWQPKWINFAVWGGNEAQGLSPNIINIMKGEKIVVRYYPNTGGYKDTTFFYKEATSIIAGAIGINKNIDKNKQEELKKLRKEMVKEVENCRKKWGDLNKRSDCRKDIFHCYKQANGDMKKFKNCL